MDSNSKAGATKDSSSSMEDVSPASGIQNFIARVIDPEGHEEFDAAKRSNDVAKQEALLPRLREARLKADLIIDGCMSNEPPRTTLFGVIADIREKSGVGVRPMLSELADAIKQRIDDASKAPKNITEDDLERAAAAFAWSYANAIHDRYRPNDPDKDKDGLTTPEKLWAATSAKDREFVLKNMRDAISALGLIVSKPDAGKLAKAKKSKVKK